MGLTTCPECGLLYCDDYATDRRTHRRLHEKWEEASAELGYTPNFPPEVERIKSQGYVMMGKGETLETCVAGAEIVIRCWFDRSLGAAIRNGYWRQHPTFERYARQVYVSMAHGSAELLTALQEKYGPPIEGEMEPGASSWYPPKWHTRTSRAKVKGTGK